MHVSAAVSVMPCPPAFVDRRKMKPSFESLLKRSMAACRSLDAVLPSIRSTG